MTKAELIKLVAANNDLTKARATAVVEDVFEIIQNNVKHEESVTITGFGSFKRVERSAKSCRNPRTNEMQKIPAHKSVNFKVDKAFKELLNK